VEAMLDSEVEVQVLNAIGQSIRSTTELLRKGSNRLEMNNLGHLPEGAYFIRVKSGSDAILEKVIKKG
jgi:hypothetical protein